MEDLTSRVPGGPFTGLIITSQAAGNQRHDNSLGMTAPGTEPASPVTSTPGEVSVHEPPEISADNYDTVVVLGESGARVSPDNADRTTPYNRADGSGWNAGRDVAEPLPETFGRRPLRRGEWNEM